MEDLSEELIDKYLIGNCTENEIKQISQCIKASDTEARRLFRAEEVFQIGKFNSYANPEKLDKAEQKLYMRLKQEEKKKNRALFFNSMMRYAAIFVLVLLLGVSAKFLVSNFMKPDLLTATAVDGVKELVLADGTKVWLNKSATIKYPGEFTGSERNVYLDGEAYFEVTKNKKKPFVVENEDMRVRVLGTIFNIKNDKNSIVSEATLIEGRIEVKSNNNSGQVVLVPGQRAEFNKINGMLTVRQVDAKMDAVWRNNQIPFHQATISDITKTLESLYHVRIILSPDTRLDRTYSGILKKKDNIESVLKSLQNSVPITYKIKGDYIFISSGQR